MRLALIVVIAVSAALVAGVAGTAQFFAGRIRTQNTELLEARLQLTKLEEAAKRNAPELEAVQARVSRLEQDYATCAAQSDSLRAEVEQLRSTAASTVELAAEPGLEAVFEEDLSQDAPPAKPKKAAKAEAKELERNREDSPEAQAARQERMAEFRQMADDYFAAAIASAPNDESRARLESMDAYRRELSALRESIRNAKTDEERAELEAQAASTRDALQQVTREEQRSMLQEVGRAYGINGPDLQTFQRDMRDVMESPIFRFGGGGGGRGPGGRGGFGGR